MAVQLVIVYRCKRKKLFALIQSFARVVLQNMARVVAVQVVCDEGCAPFERANQSVLIALRMMNLARANNASKQKIMASLKIVSNCHQSRGRKFIHEDTRNFRK